VAKYSLEYSIEDDAQGNPVWVTAQSATGDNACEAPIKTTSVCYWNLDLKNTQPAKFRIYMRAGNKNTATYVDNFTLYYTGEEGGPVEKPTVDVNGDGEVSVADVNKVIECILAGTVIDNCDVNGDGEVTVADVNLIIEAILQK